MEGGELGQGEGREGGKLQGRYSDRELASIQYSQTSHLSIGRPRLILLYSRSGSLLCTESMPYAPGP